MLLLPLAGVALPGALQATGTDLAPLRDVKVMELPSTHLLLP